MWNPIEYEEPPVGSTAVVSRPTELDTLHGALRAGLDRLAHGVALLEKAGTVRFANTSARSLWSRLGWAPASAGAPLRLPSCWPQALVQVCTKGKRELLRVRMPDDTTISVVLSPLALPQAQLAFAVFGRDELCGSVELQMFALRYQLTPAETAVLRQLCRGLNAAAIAQDHGVARTTVLTQIAAIRAKTQSSSVRSLLDALARMPPVRALVPSMELY
ncbi:hypothetical protein [Pseudorhodoferax sp. Leaf274]|uniref:hypothetical protein n=1 Tax=Pseudorhodoferax sp. Leaf274 TaxID=1736318 RepID=UPI0012E1DA2C|nr:hypothetical protein [Pseudorhodoferax sp. Leaf274]